jgi:hypothetical protein
MTTHSEDLVSLEELRSVLNTYAGPDNPRDLPNRHGLRRLRPVLVAAVAVAALAGAGVAIAAGLGVFEGTPAPPDVSASFSQLNRMPDAAVQQGIAAKWPQADVSKAHGVIEVQTPDGPEDLWAAPNDQGGQCYFIDWANDPTEQDGTKYGFGGCPPAWSTTNPINSPGLSWIVGHPSLMTAWGIVSVDAASVELTLQDGSTMTLPVVEHVFLGSIGEPAGQTGIGDTRIEKATAFDASGNQVSEWTSPQ